MLCLGRGMCVYVRGVRGPGLPRGARLRWRMMMMMMLTGQRKEELVVDVVVVVGRSLYALCVWYVCVCVREREMV